MKQLSGWGCLLMIGCAQFILAGTEGVLRAPMGLTVEYLRDPVGLDCREPRLSWKLETVEAGIRDVGQTAYQIQVATSLERLNQGRADLWDSGRVPSGQSLNVVYKGSALRTSQRCHWRVRAWSDKDDSPSTWSLPGRWVMGVLASDDWQAKWIGAHASTRPDCDLAGAKWIWTGDGGSLDTAAAGTNYFRKTFDLPNRFEDAPVMLALTADDAYEVFINGQLAAKTWGHLNVSRWMRFVEVGKFLVTGRNLIAVKVTNSRIGPTGLLLALKFPDGGNIVTDTGWSVSSGKEKGHWQKALEEFSPEGWKAATIAAEVDGGPWGKIERRLETVSPAFEKRFVVSQTVTEATLHITGLGFYEARLNGLKIGRKVLDPVPSKYDKRVFYSTYDLTDQVKRGENRFDVLLGHGWYDVRSVAVWNFDNASWRDFPRMIAQLELVYADGTRATIVSDATWRQVASPIGFDCIREGEVIGKPPPGAPDLAATTIMAEIVPAPAGRLTAEALPPSVIAQEIKPVSVRALRPGVWIADFGQNMAGWVRLAINDQKAGDVITVKYGEKVDERGGLSRKGTDAHFRYPASFRILRDGWFQTDRFVCDGRAGQVYEPRFTYNGFQYVELHGLKDPPTAKTLVACVVQTDFPDAGSFTSGNELLNKLQQAIRWAYRSNFVNGYPTDCPHREKNGWTGDAHLASELAMYNFQNTAAYEKWIGDLVDEQQPDGNLAAIVPTSGWGYTWGNGPAWDSALLIIPWMLYVYQGDTRILEKAYPAMRRYVDYVTSRAKDGIASHGLGDWIPVKSVTPAAVTSTGYYHLDAQIVARTAELLGQSADAKKYSALAETIRAAYHRTFYKGDGLYSIGSQTAQSCALHQGLAPASERGQVENRLIECVMNNKAYPDFGILGSKYVFRALSEAGRSDLAYAMATKEDGASYGTWIRRGATTFWEDWGEGESRNHIMFGDVSAWFYQYLGGIRLDQTVSAVAVQADADAVAFKTFVIAPEPVDGLDWVRAEHDSPYGIIRSQWRKEKGLFRLEVDVPVNTHATIHVPVKAGAGQVMTDIRPVRSERDRKVYKVGSGHYVFEIR